MDKESASNSSIFNNFEGEEMMGKVILFSIISLFTAIVFFLLLHLYARLFWWRVEQHFNLNLSLSDTPGSTVLGRDHQRHRFIFAQAQEDPPCNTGLDSSILESIPIIVFKSCDFKKGLECAVCLSDLIDGENARVLPICNHGFHVDCIDMWFQSHSTCPLCRNTIGSVGDTSHGGNEGLSQDQTESLNFPTNVLVWGDHNQVRSVGHVVTQDSSNDHQQEVVINIGANPSDNLSERIEEEEEPKSPMFARLRSFTKFLSREKKGVVCSSGSSDSNNNNV